MLPGINYPKKLINAGRDFIDKARLEVRREVSESDVTLFEPHLRYFSACEQFDKSWNRSHGDDASNGAHLVQDRHRHKVISLHR